MLQGCRTTVSSLWYYATNIYGDRYWVCAGKGRGGSDRKEDVAHKTRRQNNGAKVDSWLTPWQREPAVGHMGGMGSMPGSMGGMPGVMGVGSMPGGMAVGMLCLGPIVTRVMPVMGGGMIGNGWGGMPISLGGMPVGMGMGVGMFGGGGMGGGIGGGIEQRAATPTYFAP